MKRHLVSLWRHVLDWTGWPNKASGKVELNWGWPMTLIGAIILLAVIGVIIGIIIDELK